jgi:hypothetical protein
MRIATCVSYPEDQLEGPQLGRRMNQGGSVFVGKLDRAVWLMQPCRRDGEIQNLVFNERLRDTTTPASATGLGCVVTH